MFLLVSSDSSPPSSICSPPSSSTRQRQIDQSSLDLLLSLVSYSRRLPRLKIATVEYCISPYIPRPSSLPPSLGISFRRAHNLGCALHTTGTAAAAAGETQPDRTRKTGARITPAREAQAHVPFNGSKLHASNVISYPCFFVVVVVIFVSVSNFKTRLWGYIFLCGGEERRRHRHSVHRVSRSFVTVGCCIAWGLYFFAYFISES
jgi:hypothetical protein